MLEFTFPTKHDQNSLHTSSHLPYLPSLPRSLQPQEQCACEKANVGSCPNKSWQLELPEPKISYGKWGIFTAVTIHNVCWMFQTSLSSLYFPLDELKGIQWPIQWHHEDCGDADMIPSRATHSTWSLSS